tara:strand:+ start:297 stop:533 length:237 start_codon:yes stop_codon:yes gene_type:complete
MSYPFEGIEELKRRVYFSLLTPDRENGICGASPLISTLDEITGLEWKGSGNVISASEDPCEASVVNHCLEGESREILY